MRRSLAVAAALVALGSSIGYAAPATDSDSMESYPLGQNLSDNSAGYYWGSWNWVSGGSMSVSAPVIATGAGTNGSKVVQCTMNSTNVLTHPDGWTGWGAGISGGGRSMPPIAASSPSSLWFTIDVFATGMVQSNTVARFKLFMASQDANWNLTGQSVSPVFDVNKDTWATIGGDPTKWAIETGAGFSPLQPHYNYTVIVEDGYRFGYDNNNVVQIDNMAFVPEPAAIALGVVMTPVLLRRKRA